MGDKCFDSDQIEQYSQMAVLKKATQSGGQVERNALFSKTLNLSIMKWRVMGYTVRRCIQRFGCNQKL